MLPLHHRAINLVGSAPKNFALPIRRYFSSSRRSCLVGPPGIEPDSLAFQASAMTTLAQDPLFGSRGRICTYEGLRRRVMSPNTLTTCIPCDRILRTRQESNLSFFTIKSQPCCYSTWGTCVLPLHHESRIWSGHRESNSDLSVGNAL